MPFSFDYFCLSCCFVFFHLQGEESLTLLKSLTLAEAEKVAERLTIWGTLVLQNKADNSEEVPSSFML